MTELILDNEPAIRLAIFLGVLGSVAAWEAARRFSRWRRWPSNFGIVVLNTVVLRLLFPAAAVGMAWYVREHGWGLFNAVEVPAALAVILCVVALDLFIYLQHVMFHAVPALWRLHRMHHTDLDFDVTTGARFHPIEIVLSMLIKLAAVVVLGAPPVAVVIFE
ncbi:MAG: sterol desaturase family protein, partial [Alphaproteobacteria bacterium]